MNKKFIIGVCGLVFVAALSSFAFADQSIDFQKYFNEGLQAYNEHDDQKAFRCFKIAQVEDPSNEETYKYLDVLEQRGVGLESKTYPLTDEQTIGYRYYFNGGIEAYDNHDLIKAARYFRIAQIYDPSSKDVEKYLKVLGVTQEENLPALNEEPPLVQKELYQQDNQSLEDLQKKIADIIARESNQGLGTYPPEEEHYVPPPETIRPAVVPQQPPVEAEEPEAQAVVERPINPPASIQTQAPAAQGPELPTYTPPYVAQQQPETALPVPQGYTPPTVQPPSASASPAIYVSSVKSKQAPVVLELSQLINNGQNKLKLQIDINSSVIIEGKNIQKFLVVQEGYITVTIVDTDHLRIDAIRIGTTFLHIWDDSGRHSLFVEVVFPKSNNPSGQSQEYNGVDHSKPFTMTYGNDWDTYYSGKNISNLKRQSYEFTQNLAINGETPYGFFDAYGDWIDYNNLSEFDTYTMGLSQIPLPGTSNFNVRVFDALRYMSPLTMPGTRLRGYFADVDVLDNLVGLSFSHGKEELSPFGGVYGGAVPLGSKEYYDSYIDAAKITLFPTNANDQYSFNYATAYGSERPSYLTDHVYSIEGQHKFNDFLTLNAEEGNDTNHDSTLASLRWQKGTFNTGLNFRNIDKDYTTISNLPSYQGETGVAWTTDGEYKRFSEYTFVEAYRDRLDANPDDPSAYNYDANGQLRVNITPNLWSDSNFNYVDTPGEYSPNSSLGLNERISRNFGIWNNLKGTVFSGVGYQNSHSSDSDITNFDRENVIAGIELPLTAHVSAYSNYEYDWERQPLYGDSTPSVFNTGLEYQKQISPKLSFTSQIDYHDELGVKANSNGFLSGEQSVIVTSGFNYSPTEDMNFFADANASKVLSHVGNPSYDDFEVHLGIRLTFGGATYWDPLGTVSGIVFKDRNGDGRFGPGDEGIANVKVKIGDKEAITDRNGYFHIQIRAKGVMVAPILDTIPGGLLFSTPESLHVVIIQGRKSEADFGLIVQTGIYGLVFVDNKGSGVPADGDTFVGKVKVILDGKTVQKTDSHGAFYFRKVDPGKHKISLDITSLPINMVPSIKLVNKIEVSEGSNYMFNIPVQNKKADISADEQ